MSCRKDAWVGEALDLPARPIYVRRNGGFAWAEAASAKAERHLSNHLNRTNPHEEGKKWAG
jgi:hypothetical protein